IFGLLLFLWISAVTFKLVKLQVIDYGDWVQRAQRQQQRTIEVSPRRGIIYDRSGHELAMSVMVDSIFAVPSEIPDHATTASLLANVLGLDANEIQAKLDGSKNFCWIARKVNAETSERIQALRLKGIYPQKEPKRFYPKRELAAQVLGYVGVDDDGLGGIEQTYDDDLRGHSGKMMITRDARGARLGRTEKQPEPGANVVLTIDEKIQYIAEREIDVAMEETKAVGATIVVQNPKTGEILALANRPTFNPNTFNSVPDVKALKDHAVSDVFEPGSMFKTVTVSAALEEKVTKPDDLYDVSQGFIVVGGARMRDAHRMGVLTTAEVIAKSSNVGAIKIGMKLGEDRLYKYIRGFGFGQATGIELPGETRGLVKPVKNWSKTSIGAMSMGQEVGVTPIQVISAVSTIANDGVYNAPRIVAGITPPNAGPQQIVYRPAESRRVISTMTAAQMKQMLEGVVLFGTGRKALLDGYTSAGKTGTAQKVDPATGRYGNKYVASFTGFAPVKNPAITISVIIDSAQGLHQGGQISAPVWARVAQQVLAYLNVPHDVEPKNSQRQMLRASAKDDKDLEEESPDHLAEAPNFATAETQPDLPVAQNKNAQRGAMPTLASGPQLIPAATRKQVIQPVPVPTPIASPASPPVATGGGTVVLNVNGATVPIFLGKSLRAAVEASQQAGVELDAHGSGVAREQSPAPGMRVAPGTKVVVRFAR
ncbi:MAG TPA: penicillin-binding transpeptidase domain-containing protein, partial [Terriglobales bacterium]|nr:penicillin-binding transpeptidase domain-containing protein [Terriglobales bacterium]